MKIAEKPDRMAGSQNSFFLASDSLFLISVRTGPMRILLLADIHSNWPALAAIDEEFDICLFLGDLVDYATDPVPCIEWIQKHATHLVRGNHDHSIAQRVAIRPTGTFRLLQLGSSELRFVPDEYVGNDADQWRMRLDHVDVDFVCVGHTHVPMHLHVDDTQIVNPGSVGQPRDGNPQASYAVIDDGQVEFHRVDYESDRTIEHMRQSGIDEDAVRSTEQILRSGGAPAPA